jgi:predicted acylesterase/phospholipase RssA
MTQAPAPQAASAPQASTPLTRPDRPKEHRLAVVMNGGVSLAVWMGGFARELDNLRRASNELPVGPVEDSDAGRAERRLYELWQQHARAKNKRVVVDVIAGTSAGGLNGVLLSLAIANGVPLTSLRELWMRAAGFGTDQLLRPQQGGALSFLNGGYFLDQINAAVADLNRPGAPADRAPVALTVTATALRGQPRVAYDSRGNPFDEPDHRRRFDFRYSPGQTTYGKDGFGSADRDDFTTVDAVARTARASASFPVAFNPVDEIPTMRDLRSWPNFDTGDGCEWLVDGGVLDNSPFDPVLRAIADQPVEATWQRTLCYVVPSVDEAPLGTEIPPADPDRPPPWTSVMMAAFGLPREADLRDDVEQIHTLIRAGRSCADVKRFSRLVEDSDWFVKALGLATAGFPLYQQTRAVTAVYEMRDIVAAASRNAYLDPETDVEESDIPDAHPWKPDAFPVAAFPAEWTWGVTAAGRVVSMFVRSLAGNEAVADSVRQHLSDVAAKIAAVHQAITAGLAHDKNATADEPPIETILRGDAVYSTLNAPAVLASLVRDAAETYVQGVPGRPESRRETATADDDTGPGVAPALRVLQAALCVEVLNGAGGQPVEPKTPPIFDFARFGLAKPPSNLRSAFPAGAAQTPAARAAETTPPAILYGTRLSHFAAFGHLSWREWDWLWGRLHAAVHLGGLLGLTDAEIDEIAELIIKAEGRTVDGVRATIPNVLQATVDDLLEQMRADNLVRPAVDALFEMIASRRKTTPPYPDALRWAAVLAPYDTPSGLDLTQRAVHAAVEPLRLILRHLLDG